MLKRKEEILSTFLSAYFCCQSRSLAIQEWSTPLIEPSRVLWTLTSRAFINDVLGSIWEIYYWVFSFQKVLQWIQVREDSVETCQFKSPPRNMGVWEKHGYRWESSKKIIVLRIISMEGRLPLSLFQWWNCPPKNSAHSQMVCIRIPPIIIVVSPQTKALKIWSKLVPFLALSQSRVRQEVYAAGWWYFKTKLKQLAKPSNGFNWIAQWNTNE